MPNEPDSNEKLPTADRVGLIGGVADLAACLLDPVAGGFVRA